MRLARVQAADTASNTSFGHMGQASSGAIRMIDQLDAAADSEGMPGNAQRAAAILAEMLDALYSAARSLAEDQKLEVCGEAAAIAEAARAAARSLDRSENPGIAAGADRLADRIARFSSAIRESRWHEIIADTKDFARRRPILFSLGAAAAGFFAGRFLSLPSGRRESPPANWRQAPRSNDGRA
jgi:hypothetical protein